MGENQKLGDQTEPKVRSEKTHLQDAKGWSGFACFCMYVCVSWNESAVSLYTLYLFAYADDPLCMYVCAY